MKHDDRRNQQQSAAEKWTAFKALLSDRIRRIRARKDELLGTQRGRRIAYASLGGLILIVVIIIAAAASCRSGRDETIRTASPGLPKLGAVLASLSLAPEEQSSPDRLVLSGAGHTLILKAGSSSADLDGIPVAMPGNAEIAADGSWEIPADAASTLLLPVLNGSRIPVRSIVIDPGHGGNDRGTATALGHLEKDLNLLLAMELAKELRQAGFNVSLTRTDDRFIPLELRPDFAAKQRADLFVSIHHNASAANPEAAGPEIYVLDGQTPEQIETSGKSCFTAFAMCQELLSSGLLPMRGVKRADFKVLRLSPCPAVLVEAGFLTNPAEADRLVTIRNRRAIAAALAAAIKRSTVRQSAE